MQTGRGEKVITWEIHIETNSYRIKSFSTGDSATSLRDVEKGLLQYFSTGDPEAKCYIELKLNAILN